MLTESLGYDKSDFLVKGNLEFIFLIILGGLPRSTLRSMFTGISLSKPSSTINLFSLVAFPTTAKGHLSLLHIASKIFKLFLSIASTYLSCASFDHISLGLILSSSLCIALRSKIAPTPPS